MTFKRPIYIYTDGGCTASMGGAGGWGYVAVDPKGDTHEAHGGEMGSTNNRMELMAAVQALEDAPKGSTLVVVTDSIYVKRGISEWINNWLVNGWKTYDNTPVKNKDLWERLLAAKRQHVVRFDWVKGHNGNVHNERADALATMGLEKALATWKPNEGGSGKTTVGAA
jgi:ribonuclease HI